jgi:tetratricopeptide (TPR) repeat protein
MKMDFICSIKRLETKMKTLKYSLIILVVFMIVSKNLQAQTKEIPVTTSSKEALKLFSDGRDKFENIEFVAAIPLFEKSIKIDPNFALAYLYRAQSGGGNTVFRQNLNKAVALANKVSDGEKYLILNAQARADGNGQKENEYRDWLLKNFPSDKRVQMIVGNYYFNIGDNANALVYFKKATELDKNFPVPYNLIGYCQSALNNYQEAEKAFQTYIKLIPNNGNPYDSYGELLLKMGKFDESIIQYKKAVEKDPVNFVGSLAGIGNNYIFKGDYETARKYYQDYYDKAPTAGDKLTALFWKATSYVHEGKIENAIKTFDEYRALAEKENHVTNAINSYTNQAWILTETGSPAEGKKYLEKQNDLIGTAKLSEGDKENYLTGSMMANIYFLTANGELDKALAESEKCKQKVESRKNPGEEMGFNLMMGMLETRKGNYDQAIAYFSKTGTGGPMEWYYTALAYDKKGDRQNALKLFEKIAKWNVNGLDLALFRKRALEELKK